MIQNRGNTALKFQVVSPGKYHGQNNAYDDRCKRDVISVQVIKQSESNRSEDRTQDHGQRIDLKLKRGSDHECETNAEERRYDRSEQCRKNARLGVFLNFDHLLTLHRCLL